MSKILEEEIYGKVATPKRKILGEFIEKYVILSTYKDYGGMNEIRNIKRRI